MHIIGGAVSQSMVGGPKWTKIDLCRPQWTKMDHFGPNLGLANIYQNPVLLSLHEAILLRTSSRGLSQGIKDAKVKLIQGQGGKEKFSP